MEDDWAFAKIVRISPTGEHLYNPAGSARQGYNV